MLSVLVAICLVSASSTPPPDEDRAVYDAAKAKVGRDPEAHVKLALWCEAHGLPAERMKHLAIAVLTDPKNATARGLLGLVDFRGRWERPEAVSAKVESDEALAAKLAEYNARRARMAGTAEAHWNLAHWCEANGLPAEAQAHLASVTRLDPAREAAWKRLGFKKQGGRWVTEAQLAAEKGEAEAQKKADQHWKPLLTRWRGWLHEKGKKDQAEEALAGVTDPRAVPAVWAVFAGGEPALQAKAVQVLGQIDAAGASRGLAMLAVFGGSADVRRAATETLKRRDPRDFVGLLVGLIRDPLKYEVRPVNGPGMPGELFVEGKKYDVRRIYGLTSPQITVLTRLLQFWSPSPFDYFAAQPAAADPMAQAIAANPSIAPPLLAGHVPGPITNAHPSVVDVRAGTNQVNAFRRMAGYNDTLNYIQQAVATSQQQLNDDIGAIEAVNTDIRQVNGALLPTLNALTGVDQGESSEAWQKWWTDQRGYAYESDTPAVKPTFTTFVVNPVVSTHHSCFEAGTLVRTLGGPRPIESIRVGDQVLSQAPGTGRLSYTPVVAVFHNPPAPTLRIGLGEETIVATGIHRFWKAGQGWAMARELKPGDAVRVLGGVAQVSSVEGDRVQPVFNLQVAEGASFFVGRQGTLVHDNSLVQPVPDPFDAAPNLATASAPGTISAADRGR